MADKVLVLTGQTRRHLLNKQVGGCLTIEVDVAYVWVFFEKAVEVIGYQAIIRDSGIQAARPVACCDDIPQGDMIFVELL